jgi:predicted ATPase/class 3 adenylate cyclase
VARWPGRCRNDEISPRPKGNDLVSEPQSGVVTFLFTDVEGSTRVWETEPAAMSGALARHDALLNGAIDTAGGQVFKTAGDAFCAVFAAPAAAIAAAVAAQQALANEAWQISTPLRVRMAIHAGHPELRDADYFGPPLNRVARLLASAHGGQILVSRAAGELARDHLPPEASLRELGDYALKDLQQAERVFQVSAPGLLAEFPPLHTPELLLRTIPRPATPLIGRAEEIAAIRAIFGLTPDDATPAPSGAPRPHRQPARLVTLTGPGGAGKTRLSLHLALTLGVQLADGALFVSLAAITDPALVPVEIADALELGDGSGEPARDLLVAALRDRELLLVLDNFEQVMSASGLVADLLAHCPRLRVLATSRERLNIRGEHDLPLPPLQVPELSRGGISAAEDHTDRALSLDDVRHSEAVRLFVERAQSVNPDFDLTADNAAAVVEICHRLDGLPLAIELAAARIRFLPPRALLDRFDHRLDVLNRGSRDLPARQKTMRDTIAWSYDLLEPAEQRLFTRLAVFVGGATLDAVAAVAGGADGDGDDVELLESLAEKSLVRLLAGGDEPRVVMLQTIRDYGLERLTASDEHESMRQRHAEHFLALAEEAEPQLAGSAQKRWLDRLDDDQDNLRAAIGWLREATQIEAALRLGGALWRFWWLRGDIGEGRGQLESLLRQEAPVSPTVRAKALNGAGVLAESQGDLETADRFHRESLDISRRIGDAQCVAWSLNNLGVVAINQGDFARAEALLQENLAMAEEAGDLASIATALIDLSQIAHVQGDYAQATTLTSRSLSLFRTLGNDSMIARALTNLGTFAYERGEFDQAFALLTESLALHRNVGDRLAIAGTLNNLAEVEREVGNPEAAMRLFLESHILAQEGGSQLYAAVAMQNLAALTRVQGDVNVAERRFRDALLHFRSVGDQFGIAECLVELAKVAAERGQVQEAASLLGVISGLCAQNLPAAPAGFDEAILSLRNTMDRAAFDEAWRAGNAMTLNDALDGVLDRGASLVEGHVATG